MTLRPDTAPFQITETRGALTPAERAAKTQRRVERRKTARAHLDACYAERVSGGPPAERTLTPEELVEARRMAHERVRMQEAQQRMAMRKKTDSLTGLKAVDKRSA